jgi:hypothetical protein
MDQLEVNFSADADFSTDTDGTFPMTWGQQDFWRRKIRVFGEASWNFNIPMVVDLPDDVGWAGLDTLAGALRRLVERNQALRAHFFEGTDGLFQQIARSGTFILRLRQAAPEASRARAEALAAELAAAHFNHETEWGIRIALVCAGALPRHVVFAVSHLVADGGGIQALIDDLLNLVRAAPGGGEPNRRWQPVDQARREQSVRGARRNQGAIRYWRKQLERIPMSMFPDPAGFPDSAGSAGQPRFRRLRLDSRALAVAAPRLAAACQVSVPSVVLAGTALALIALSGQATCVLMVVVGNRYDEDMRGMVGSASQDGLFVVGLPGGTIAEAVRATHRAFTAACFYGHYDPGAIEELAGAVAVSRGVPFDPTVVYNDLSAFVDGADDSGADDSGSARARVPEADARRLLGESVIAPESTWQGQSCKMYLAAEPGGDICRLRLVTDTAYLPPDTMRALLRGIEKIVVEAAYRDVGVAGIPALTGLKPGDLCRRR